MSARSAFSVPNPADEQRRAANGYLVWPLAVANIVREGEDASIWARLHARQALVLGLLGSALLFVVLALPLLAVLALPGISSGTTIDLYGVGLVVDIVVALGLLVVGMRYAARAARGELFAVPVVTAIVERWFRIRR